MNKNKILKKIRIIWSLLVLLALLSIFLIPDNIFAVAAKWQIIPLGLRSIAFFALFLFISLIFGRIYCSFACPLGVLQDIAIYTAKIIKLPQPKKQFAPNHKVLRYSVLVLLLGALFMGIAIPLGMFAPFAILGRVSVAQKSILLLVVGNAVFLAIIITASLRGRLFCNTFCPVGAMLGLLAKISYFQITFNQNTCSRCGKCAKGCKANCIDIKDGIVDNERCVKCFNCTAVCDEDSINYCHPQNIKLSKPDLSKRDFLIIGGSAVIGAAVLPKLLKATHSPKTIMPPGALDFERFNSKCTACQLCVSNCPENIIKPAAMQYGLGGFLQPRLDYNHGKCKFECVTCSNICPNGALESLTLERKQHLQIGLAKYAKKHCVVVNDETHCGTCSENCPTGAIDMVDWENGLTIPKVNPKLCIGCGACEYICPARPDKAIIVSGSKKQIQAKVASIKQAKDHLKGKDFPF